MPRRPEHAGRGFVRTLVAVVLGVVIASALISWTRSLARDKRREQLRKSLKALVAEDGERALFDLAGIPVKEILYGNDGLVVLAGSDWEYTFDEMQNMRVYDQVGPAVVSVSATTGEGRTERGSGFFISDNGYFLTNAHVVEDARQIVCLDADGTDRTARVVGISSIDDVAVLKIDLPSGTVVKTAKLGDSGKLRVGQKVIALGNPYGYERTLTSGVVGGLNRSVKTNGGKVIMHAIQTDAAVNPGSSGGPLVDGRGEVVGITSSIFTIAGGQAVGFAIPVDTVLSLLPDLLSYGTVRRGWIDITPVQVTPAIADYASLPVRDGVLVSAVEPGSPAEQAGLKGGTEAVRYGNDEIYLGGDVIVAIGSRKIHDMGDLYMALLDTREGDTVPVTVVRSGLRKTIEVTLSGRDSEDVGALVR